MTRSIEEVHISHRCVYTPTHLPCTGVSMEVFVMKCWLPANQMTSIA